MNAVETDTSPKLVMGVLEHNVTAVCHCVAAGNVWRSGNAVRLEAIPVMIGQEC